MPDQEKEPENEEPTEQGVDAPEGATPSGPPSDAEPKEVPEPPTATHGAEDEAWETGGDDAPHLEEEVKTLRSRIEELEGDLKEAKERWLRARADYDNLSRRTETERENLAAQAAGRIVERLLDPLEALKRAAAEMEGVEGSHAQGVRLTHRSLATALEQEGLEEVPGVGSPFDVQVHEAIARESAPEAEGTVIEVLRPGYRLRGKLLRPALVKVSAGPE